MNEQEWLACTDPQRMLKFLAVNQNPRKLQLFAVACCRLLRPLLTDPQSRKALRMAERFVDGEASAEKLRLAWEAARQSTQPNRHRSRTPTLRDDALWAVTLVVEGDFSRFVWLGDTLNRAFARAKEQGLTEMPEIDEVSLLRCIFGNPFRSTTIDPACLAWNGGIVPKIAKAIRNERRFDHMPILANALEETGCDNAEILAHLRGPGPHVRGCWALDLILGKE